MLAIARKESFRAAAIDLGLSATALSNAIAKLEGQLGVRLFNRTTRSVSLTEAGHRFVEQVTPALRDIHHALDTVRSQQDTPSGTLRINTFATAAREIMQPLVLEFLKRFPQVRIDLVTEGALSDIVADGFDFGVRSRDLVPSDMIAIPVGPERRHAIVAAPAYLADRTHPRVPADLLAHPCIRIRLPNGVMYRWHFGAEGQSLHLEVDGPLILDEASVARLAVLEGVGIGFFMESDVRADIEAGRLVSLLPQWLPALTPICLYYPSRRNPPAAVKVFIDLARERSRAYRHE
ncbi:DNA-binding transcriptional LysR family regulator [Sphingobium sp. B2D3B]|nr:DNA-binding transcriptional LysR family regulator [Sphingobium sp. B2D3B]MCW2399256.1 DNA-binding transcriptional LysR family regulator [Sphingobium sp. B2D3C]